MSTSSHPDTINVPASRKASRSNGWQNEAITHAAETLLNLADAPEQNKAHAEYAVKCLAGGLAEGKKYVRGDAAAVLRRLSDQAKDVAAALMEHVPDEVVDDFLCMAGGLFAVILSVERTRKRQSESGKASAARGGSA